MAKTVRPRLGARIGSIDPTQLTPPARHGAGDTAPPRTGVGLVMGAIAGNSELEARLGQAQQQLADARQALAEHDGNLPTKKLDPATIRLSRWANRDEANFSGEAWAAFKSELASSGGNVQPIKVRRIAAAGDGGMVYEAVFGHRRLRGCSELGLPVLAMVEDGMTDEALFAEMDRENRLRQNLSAWEQGRHYNKGLSEGLFASQRQMAEKLGVNQADISRACALAKLPDDIVRAFPTPMSLQVRMAKPLGDKLQSDPDGILERARALHVHRGRLSAGEVLDQLLGKSPAQQDDGVSILANGAKAAALRIGSKGRAVIEFEPGVLDASKHDDLIKLISQFLASETA